MGSAYHGYLRVFLGILPLRPAGREKIRTLITLISQMCAADIRVIRVRKSCGSDLGRCAQNVRINTDIFSPRHSSSKLDSALGLTKMFKNRIIKIIRRRCERLLGPGLFIIYKF